MPHLAPHSRHTRRTISAGVSVKAPGFPPVRMALVSLPAPPRSLGLNAWKLVMTILAAAGPPPLRRHHVEGLVEVGGVARQQHAQPVADG